MEAVTGSDIPSWINGIVVNEIEIRLMDIGMNIFMGQVRFFSERSQKLIELSDKIINEIGCKIITQRTELQDINRSFRCELRRSTQQ